MDAKTLYRPRFDEPLFVAGEDVLVFGLCSSLHDLARSPHVDWRSSGDNARMLETWTRKSSPVFNMAHSTIPGIRTRYEDPIRRVTLPGAGPEDPVVKVVAISRLFGTPYHERDVCTYLLMSDVTGIGKKFTEIDDVMIEADSTPIAALYCKAREYEHMIIARACEVLSTLIIRHPGFFSAYPLPHL